MRSFLAALLSAALIALPALVDGADRPARIEFNRDIRPLLADRCFACHGPDAGRRKADLRLDVESGAKADHDGRHAVVPGKPQESELIARITSDDATERMPPSEKGKPLAPAEIELFRRWIEQGAEYQPHWAYLPPKRPAVPLVKNNNWPRNDIDRFVLARLEAEGLVPSPEADRPTLIRRLSFDLTGLPPSLADVEAFVTDNDPRAYERLVDRLLASPHYGERMAVYWLDLVRYANTVGYHGDQEHPITPYRDWVIKALNDNMPFEQFTLEQLAGDLLPDATIDQKIATGYNRVLQTSHEGGVQKKEYQHKYDADRIRNLSVVWMGATLGCAECHDHKFDPYTQRDFYRMVALFADLDDNNFKGTDSTPTNREPELVVLSPLDRDRINSLEAQLQDLESRVGQAQRRPTETQPAADTATAKKSAEQLRAEIDTLKKRMQRTMVAQSAAPRTIRVLNRGDWLDETGEIVGPGVPQFMKQLDVAGRRPNRVDLARWLTSPDHPQTSRVFVNRIWYLLFGTGLSRSLEDNGAQGEWPVHPELLDWLAVEFSNPKSEIQIPKSPPWDIKRLIRLIVTSAAYRQSSLEPASLRERDPDNRLFARQSRFRLPAEMIRDNALALSGLLVDRLGGATAHPYQPAGYYVHLNFPKRDYKEDRDENQYRRGVYMHWQRQYLHPMLRAFDAPSREECTAQRQTSNTPQAALVLLNDPTFIEAARVFAARIVREGGDTETDCLIWAWRTALSRAPSEREAAALRGLYQFNRREYDADPAAAARLLAIGLAPRPANIDPRDLAAWTAVAHTILNLNETTMRN